MSDALVVNIRVDARAASAQLKRIERLLGELQAACAAPLEIDVAMDTPHYRTRWQRARARLAGLWRRARG